MSKDFTALSRDELLDVVVTQQAQLGEYRDKLQRLEAKYQKAVNELNAMRRSFPINIKSFCTTQVPTFTPQRVAGCHHYPPPPPVGYTYRMRPPAARGVMQQ